MDERLEQRLDERFKAEREVIRQLVREEVRSEVGQQFDNFVQGEFKSFIEDSFDPAVNSIERHFESMEDHLDRLDIEVANLKTDMRHVKQVLQIRPRNGLPATG